MQVPVTRSHRQQEHCKSLDALDHARDRARAWFLEKEQEVAIAANGEDEAPYTVNQAQEDYIGHLRAEKGQTAAKDAEGRVRKHLLPKFGDKVLAELTTAELNRWRNSMVRVAQDIDDEEEIEQERRSRDTANRFRSSAFAAFNLAFNSGDHTDLDDRIWRRVKPFKNVGAARIVILTEAEQQKLTDACEPGLREFALLVAWTGGGPGKELTEARVRDLDVELATLTVRGKTGGRDVHLGQQALSLLKRLANGKRPNEHLLTTAAGTPWTKSLHTRRVEAAVKRAGIAPATNLYALRHSYISSSLRARVPVEGVTDQWGTSITMIQRYYAKFIPSDLAKYAKTAARPSSATSKAQMPRWSGSPGRAGKPHAVRTDHDRACWRHAVDPTWRG